MSSDPAATFEPVQRAPLSLLVARQLRERIVAGDLVVGSRLPSEKELTEQFEVSRSTIREALRILQAQGLLSGGDRVTTTRPQVSDEHTVASAARGLENVLRLGQVPLDDLLELRLLLEEAALARAATDPDPAALDDARAALAVMTARDVDIDAFHRADVAFHVALSAAAGNRAYHLTLGVLRDAIAEHLDGALRRARAPRQVMRRLADEHATILAAVEAGDPARACAHVEAHIRGFYTRDGDLGGPG